MAHPSDNNCVAWDQAASCQPVSLKLENQTMDVVSIECLKQAQQQGGAPQGGAPATEPSS